MANNIIKLGIYPIICSLRILTISVSVIISVLKICVINSHLISGTARHLLIWIPEEQRVTRFGNFPANPAYSTSEWNPV